MKLQLSLLSIFLTSLLSGSAVTPMLPSLADSFGSPSLARTFLTLPSIIIIPFLFLSGTFEHFVSKKKLILFGLYLYLISGLLSIFISNPYILLTLRGMTGVAAGFVIPYSASLVSDYFLGEQRERILGYSGVMIYVSGIIILLSSGFLVSIYWKLGFLVNLVALIPLILITFFLPDVSSKYGVRKVPYILKIYFKAVVYKASLAYFCVVVLMFSYFTNISFLVEEANLGGSKESSIAQSFFMLAGIISNLLMHVIKKSSNILLHALQIACLSFGFIILGLYSNNVWFLYFGSFVMGIGYGSYGNSLVSTVSASTTRFNRVNALAFTLSCLYIGQFLSPLLTNGIMNLINASSYKILFFIEGLIFLFVALILFTLFGKENRSILLEMRKRESNNG